MKNALERHEDEFQPPTSSSSASSSSSAKTKAFQHYTSCVDKSKLIESIGDAPLRQILEDIGHWNLSGNFSLRAEDAIDVNEEADKDAVKDADEPADASLQDPDAKPDWNFAEQLQLLHGRFMNFAFFLLFVEPDDKNSTANILGVDENGLTLTRSYYINDTIPINAKGESILECYISH